MWHSRLTVITSYITYRLYRLVILKRNEEEEEEEEREEEEEDKVTRVRAITHARAYLIQWENDDRVDQLQKKKKPVFRTCTCTLKTICIDDRTVDIVYSTLVYRERWSRERERTRRRDFERNRGANMAVRSTWTWNRVKNTNDFFFFYR